MRLASLFLAAWLCLAGSAWAGNLSVYPLRVSLDATRNAEVLTVRNLANEPLLLQPTIVKWSQKDGKDIFEPTRDVLISPALVEIPARENQVVRLVLRRPQDPTTEMSYRVMLREVPRQASGGSNQLVLALNISLPVFVAPASGEARGRFEVTDAAAQSDGGRNLLRLTLRNRSNAHIQVTGFSLAEAGQSLGDYNRMIYILPGDSNTLSVPVSRRIISKSVRIDAQTDAGPISQEFALP